MKNKIIGLSGFIGSGKDRVADYLVLEYRYQRVSFAESLKDAISNIFGWERDLLEGYTKESREWREMIDPWWAKRLDIPHLTPRWVLQNIGTDLLRNKFHTDIWVASLENKLRRSDNKIVLSDVRFQNEIQTITNLNGTLIWVKRNPLPEWYDLAINPTTKKSLHFRSDIHPSEYDWVGSDFTHIIENNGTLDELFDYVDIIIQ